MSKIGIFDSGLGGLSVWQELVRALPGVSVDYVADSGRCPYGPQPVDNIRRYSSQITQFLLNRGCSLIVVACNTATAAAIRQLRDTFDVPFVGMEPAIKPAATHTQTRVVGVLATEGTFRGKHFQQAREQFAADTEVLLQVGHGLVEFVESGRLDGPEVEARLRMYLQPMIEAGADQIVLGCSHYPFLRPVMERIVGDQATIIDPAPAVAGQAARLWQKMEAKPAAPAEYHFFTTGGTTQLAQFLPYLATGDILQHASVSSLLFED